MFVVRLLWRRTEPESDTSSARDIWTKGRCARGDDASFFFSYCPVGNGGGEISPSSRGLSGSNSRPKQTENSCSPSHLGSEKGVLAAKSGAEKNDKEGTKWLVEATEINEQTKPSRGGTACNYISLPQVLNESP